MQTAAEYTPVSFQSQQRSHQACCGASDTILCGTPEWLSDECEMEGRKELQSLPLKWYDCQDLQMRWTEEDACATLETVKISIEVCDASSRERLHFRSLGGFILVLCNHIPFSFLICALPNAQPRSSKPSMYIC